MKHLILSSCLIAQRATASIRMGFAGTPKGNIAMLVGLGTFYYMAHLLLQENIQRRGEIWKSTDRRMH